MASMTGLGGSEGHIAVDHIAVFEGEHRLVDQVSFEELLVGVAVGAVTEHVFFMDWPQDGEVGGVAHGQAADADQQASRLSGPRRSQKSNMPAGLAVGFLVSV